MPFCCGASGKEMKEDIVVSPKSLKEPKPKLTYMNIAARGEPIRLTFVIGGIDFEDKRIDFHEMPNYATQSPTHKFPFMELDNKTYCESVAILEYAAQRAFLLPSDSLERLKADEIVSFVLKEVLPIFRSYFIAPDDEAREHAMKHANEVDLPKVIGTLERLVGQNSKAKYVVGSNVTMADVVVYCLLEHSPSGNKIIEICQQDCPRLLEVHEQVAKNTNVRAYYSKKEGSA